MTTVLERPAPAAADAPVGVSDRFRWPLRHAAMCALLVAFAFNSDSGRIGSDTKLDLTTNPGAFLSRALHLWDAQGFSGQVQNQAYGYFFPMGPFFWLGHAAGLPGWVVDRLWWAALLVAAYTGIVALTGRLGIGTPLSRAIAGLGYATSPHILTLLGPVSVEILPMCIAPWAVVPLATGLRTGDYRRAAMRCGIAALFMGAVNATVIVAALVPAAMFALFGTADEPVAVRVRARLVAWTAAAVALASAWWVFPLLLLGRYSTPFLDYIESSSTTTRITSLTESLRGTADWLAYLLTSGSRAGLLLLTVPGMVLMSAATAALGLGGLAHRAMPGRSWLVPTLLVGVVVLTAGHSASIGSPFAAGERSLLDGSLAALRNVHKFDVDIRLPIALGLAHLAGRAQRVFGARALGIELSRRLSAAVLVLASAAAVVGTAAPLVSLHLNRTNSYGDVPGYWQDAAHWLGRHDATGRVLVVPASQDQHYLWGELTDNPLQPLARSPWTERNSNPLVNTGAIRMLDAVSARLATGRGSAGLARFLRAAGIDYLLARNDLDPGEADQVRPTLVAQALDDSPGITRSTAFGPIVDGPNPLGVLDQDLRQPVRALQLWHVGGSGSVRVRAVSTDSVARVTGGPESLLDLDDAGLDATTVVLAGDVDRALDPTSAYVTDGLRKRAVNFGSVTSSSSQILTRHAPKTFDRPVEDYRLFDDQHDAVARYSGARAIRASSSAADATAPPTVPARQPYAAVDGDPTTFWQPSSRYPVIGQWLELDLAARRRVDHVTLRLPPNSPALTVSVRTDAGRRVATIEPDANQVVRLPAGTTTRVRVTVVGPTDAEKDLLPGLAELQVPGVRMTKTVVVPADEPRGTRVRSYVFTTPSDERSGCVEYADRPLCATGLAQQDEEVAGLDRSFTAPSPGVYSLTGAVVPRPGPQLDALLDRVTAPVIRATASTQAVEDPRAGPQAAVDGSTGTGWVADPFDPHPTLTLSWSRPRVVSSVGVQVDARLAATPPTAIQITADGTTFLAPIALDGRAHFPPVRTDRLVLNFAVTGGLRSSYLSTFGKALLGLGVSELSIDGLPVVPLARQDARPVQLACGTLPDMLLDGRPVQVQATTTVGAIRSLRPIAVTPCDAGTISVGTGAHHLLAPSTPAWRVAQLALTAAPGTPEPVAVRTRRWGSTDRDVHIARRASSTLLVVSENANPGWHATLHGRRLRTVTVDGWEQGYVVPAGAAGTVHLVFAPDHTYRVALLVGALAVLLLVLVAAWPARRRRARPAGVARPRRVAWAVALGGAGALYAVGGLVGLLVAVVVDLAAVAVSAAVRARPQPVRAVAAWWAGSAIGAYLLAGVALAVHPYGTVHYRSDAPALQFLALVALAAVASASLLGTGLPPDPLDDAAPAPPAGAPPRTQTTDEPPVTRRVVAPRPDDDAPAPDAAAVTPAPRRTGRSRPTRRRNRPS